jgi:hypothetical protein
VALLLLVLGVAALGDPRINSGSDAGGKTATVEAIAGRGIDGFDIGYWAGAADPEGIFHPVIKTVSTDEGWIQVTSALMPTASAAGFRVGGDLAALWLSLLAVPLGALAAAHLSRTLGARSGVLAFVTVGALSPLAFYGADQWEHAPSLAAGLWAVALLRSRAESWELLALVAFAVIAVSLRRETAFVLLALGGLELFVAEARTHWWAQRRWLAATMPLGVGLLVAVQLYDREVLGASTGGRSVSQAGTVGSDLGQRLDDSLLTTISLFPSIAFSHLVISLLPLAGLALLALGLRREEASHVRIGAVVAAIGIAMRVVIGGLAFVPGALAVLPLTAVAPILARRESRPVLWACGAATLGVLAFQWTGSLAAQWGGRYLLLPAAVVAIVAATELEGIGLRKPATVVSVGLTAIVAVLGLTWHVQRTSSIAETRDQILDVAAGEILVSTHGHFPREVAADLAGERWLVADRLEEIDDVFLLAAEVASDERVWLLHPGTCAVECARRWQDRPDADNPPGWASDELRTVDWLGGDSYVLEAFVPASVAREVGE